MADLTSLGQYQIVEKVRQGRSADTYLAEHARMRTKRVLLRVLNEEAAADEVFVSEFVTEAKAAARLQHDCIASVIDLESETPPIYTVLEFIEGMDLGAILKAFGPVPVEIAASLMCEVCRGLEYAHDAGVLHRRLRPRQIKVTPEGRVKILGFGMREQTSVIAPTVMVSDVAHEELYRSPEQVREEPEGPASDLYSCGVIFFELLTGRMPFTSLARYVAGNAAERTPPRLREVNPLVTPALASVVDRLLSERAADRPASAAAVRRELEAVLEDRGDSAGPDLMQAYLVNPPDYGATAKRRVMAELVHQAEGLARGPQAARATALRELEMILAVEPEHPGAKNLARRLRSGLPPARPAEDDPFATRVLPPGGAPAAEPGQGQPAPGAPRAARSQRPAAPAAPPSIPETRDAPPRREEVAGARRGSPLGLIALGVVAVAAIVISIIWSQGGFRREAPADDTGDATPVANAGALDVVTVPAGARITLLATGESRVGDGVFPNVPGGSCPVRVELEGYAARDTSVAVAAGETTRVVVALLPGLATAAPCSLIVQVSHPATRVLVDDVPLAGGPTRFATTILPGGHHITVEAEGFQTWTGRVGTGTKPPPRIVKDVALVPKEAEPPVVGNNPTPSPTPTPQPQQPSPPAGGVAVPIDVRPPSDVLVDNVKVASGATQTTLDLAPGSYELSFVNPDFVTVKQRLTVKAGAKIKPIKVDLAKGTGGLFVSGPKSGLRIFVDEKDTGVTTPGAVRAASGTHTVSVRDWNTKAVVASQKVLVDPNRLDNLPVKFGN